MLTGLRRSGKSTILLMLKEELVSAGKPGDEIIHINMELMEFDALKDYRDLYDYIKERLTKDPYKMLVMIDEVQEVFGWEKAVTSLFAENIGDIIITGSNAHW